jgi:neutral ceramidase
LEHGNIEVASDFLMDASINRSPSSYLLNPQSERNKYADEGDTDKTMLMLKFISDQKKPLGALNWFAVHGTSMNNTNLVSW